jgi:hypothetical protein
MSLHLDTLFKLNFDKMMKMEIDNSELLHMLESKESLEAKVNLLVENPLCWLWSALIFFTYLHESQI